MKKILMFFIGMMLMFSFQSCVVGTYATTQDDIYVEAEADVVYTNIDFGVVIRYGTPYYYNGDLLYYIYNGLYYYPFYYDNYWYVRVYRRPFNHLYHRPYFRPNRHDHRFAPGVHRGFDRPVGGHRPDNRIGGRQHSTNHRPDARPNDRTRRPDNRVSRPVENRPVARPNTQTRPQPQARPNTQSRMGSVGARPSAPASRQGSGNSGGGRFGGRR